MHHNAPAGLEPAAGMGQGARVLPQAAAEKHTVRIGQLHKGFRHFALHGLHQPGPDATHVLADHGGAPWLALHCEHAALLRQVRGLDGHGAAARAQVPDHGIGQDAQHGEAGGAHGQLGDEALLVEVVVVGNAQHERDFRRRGALHQHQVQVGERQVPGVLHAEPPGHFAGRAKILQHDELGIHHAALQKRLGDDRRAVLRIGEHGDALKARQGGEQRREVVAAMQRDHAHVVPGQAHAGRCHLQGAQVGVHHHAGSAQALHQALAQAEEQRVAIGQHHHGLARSALAGDLVENGRKRPGDGNAALRLAAARRGVKKPAPAHQHLGAA